MDFFIKGTEPDPEAMRASPQYADEHFKNTHQRPTIKKNSKFKFLKAILFNRQQPVKPKKGQIPVEPITSSQLAALKPDQTVFYRLGHSSLLIWLNGKFWLTDPIFSQRASPFQWLGPKRFHPPPLSMEELPQIEGIIISHNHYDHLDEASIKALNIKTQHFLVPLGLKAQLVAWGVAAAKITELDWWQSIQLGDVRFTATPAQHFSGRGLSDKNKSLWVSWAIQGNRSLFFSGDTGYFDGFKTIGDKLGPFDVSFIETGAYNKLWEQVHMRPAQSVQAHKDVRGKVMVPIHNATFDLALHSWYDPFVQVTAISDQAQTSAEPLYWLSPKIGEPVSVLAKPQNYSSSQWWQEFVQDKR